MEGAQNWENNFKNLLSEILHRIHIWRKENKDYQRIGWKE